MPPTVPANRRRRVPTTLPELLAEQTANRPEDIAVIAGERTRTFAELAADSAGLAAFLQRHGVGADTPVGLFLDPGVELITGVWGVLRAGGAYLPLSPQYPANRLRYMLADARVDLVLTAEALRSEIAGFAPEGTRIVTVEEVARSALANALPSDGPRHDSLAYVIYTSGSTGTPKGVMIEHHAIVNQMRWLRRAHGLDADATVVAKTPMSFDAAQWELLACGVGSTVVLARAGAYRDPDALIETIRGHEVTTLQCVPTLLQALVDTGDLGTCTSLRRVFSGGEALSRRLAARCLDQLPGAELVNLYGPTECTVNTSAHRVDKDVIANGPNTVSIGAPAAGTSYHVLDEHRRPLAVGEVGELYIGGVQLARGYLRQPELTAQRFIDPGEHLGHQRLYRTGDLVYRNADGTVQFVGRVDNQVKLRGFRIELDEVRHAVEAHTWVRAAAAIVADDPRTGHQKLVTFVELDPAEASVMDQGEAGAHHRSKASKLQVKAQLDQLGCRDDADVDARTIIALPGTEATSRQRGRAFARKTYRFFDGGQVSIDDLLRTLRGPVSVARNRGLDELTLTELGEILRNFGQFHSDERLLPKYAYASPGALYATQLYLEAGEVAGLPDGVYYYHPARHVLVRMSGTSQAVTPGISVHFVGKNQAIEPVYTKNIQEVLEIEAGHMVGLFDAVLPGYGYGIGELTDACHNASVLGELDVAADDRYLGSVRIVPFAAAAPDDGTEMYVQSHPGRIPELPAGQYRYADGQLHRVADDLVERNDVIAINQAVYDRASFGITLRGRGGPEWARYLALGRTAQHLAMSGAAVGMMPSGYSSRTGDDLAAARKLATILADGADAPTYFILGGRISEEQRRSEGMREDIVHMKGPAELIRDDLTAELPDYMVPNAVRVVDRLPELANGKVDAAALARLEADAESIPLVAPRTPDEERIHAIWQQALDCESLSVRDDFFACGGNSLIAVSLVHRLNREFGCDLPMQVLFESPTIEALARTVSGRRPMRGSRLVRLSDAGAGPAMFCWPGLGGYPMNLRPLATALGADRPVYGVQAHGVNSGEQPYPTLADMAEHDVDLVRGTQAAGPYVLCGYSFGARLAFEVARRLEAAGERVEHLFLLAPGSPRIDGARATDTVAVPSYRDRAYLMVLFSVFAGRIDGPHLAECLAEVTDDDSFAAFIADRFPAFEPAQVRRIVRIVRDTYRMRGTALVADRLAAPVSVFTARGDQRSFIETPAGRMVADPAIVRLPAGHYRLLGEPHVERLAAMLRERLAGNDARADTLAS
ncbi:non-ribosomal peptide synthetase family protein [Haloechinothrix halophila]|uniref:non-ribosomal peptide synthetase family protein n=1 Tax=Haloechinothrix halophila TaxID=1069073 RepID=UPI0004119289|nr:amino acid adenylation domain-containing protein [Haloechinothrix halophila]